MALRGHLSSTTFASRIGSGQTDWPEYQSLQKQTSIDLLVGLVESQPPAIHSQVLTDPPILVALQRRQQSRKADLNFQNK